MRPRLSALLFLGFVASVTSLRSADWPQWRGPDRTGVSRETGLLTSWPEGGPKLAWKISGLGHGYGTVSLSRGKIYVLGTQGTREFLLCLDGKAGKKLWQVEIGAERGSYPGPRSTPTVEDDRVYALSSNGKLVCADADQGRVRWKKDLQQDFGGQHGMWAYAESPLIDGQVLLCTPGGDKASLVALDKMSGKEIWRSSLASLKKKEGPGKGFSKGDFGKGGKGKTGKGGFGKGGGFGKMGGSYSTAGYASAIVAEVDGVKQYIQFVAGGVVGIRASDGKLLWNYDEPGTGSNANCSTPIYFEGSVFAAAGYGVGGGRAKIVKQGDKFKAEQLYFAKPMQNHHGGMVLINGYLYGTSNSALVCLDFKTGEVKWTARSAGKGSLTYADGHLYVRGEDGTVCLVEANPEKYVEKGRFKQPDRAREKAWAHPVVCGGKLYLRDWDALLCYEVKAN